MFTASDFLVAALYRDAGDPVGRLLSEYLQYRLYCVNSTIDPNRQRRFSRYGSVWFGIFTFALHPLLIHHCSR